MSRNLNSILLEHRAALIDRWTQVIFQTYPADTVDFFKKTKDPFANPVGQSITRELPVVFEELVQPSDDVRLKKSLDTIVRIRAVQDFSVIESLRFIYKFKDVMRQELSGLLHDPALQEELRHFETRLDELALLAFEIYLGCKEQLWEIRQTEIKNRYHLLLERVDKIYGKPDVA